MLFTSLISVKSFSYHSSSSSIHFLLFPSIFTEVNYKVKKREEVKPQGHALVKRTYRGAKRTNKKMSVERRGAQRKLEAGPILEELKNN